MSSGVHKTEKENEQSDEFMKLNRVVDGQIVSANSRVANPSGEAPQDEENDKTRVEVEQNAADARNSHRNVRVDVEEVLEQAEADLNERVDEEREEERQVVAVVARAEVL